MTIEGIDLLDPYRFARGEHHAMFEVLRAADPVYWHPDPRVGGDAGFWNVVKHGDLVDVNRDTELFSSELGGTSIWDHDPDRGGSDTRGVMMLNMDPPKHTRYRLLVNKGFTPRMIGLLEQYLRHRSTVIVDHVIERGAADFVADIASELPLQAIAEIMGVPQEDRRLMFEWSNQLIGGDDPEYATDDVRETVTELYLYVNNLAAERRGDPRDDIVTKLLNAEVDGDRLSELEFDMFMLLLTVAGNETTRNATAHGMYALLNHPDQLDALPRRRRRADAHRGRRDPALGIAGDALPPDRDGGHRDPRSRDQGGRQGRHLAHLRQPRRRGVRRPVHVRHHALTQPPGRVRRRRPALLPGREPRPHGVAADPHGADHPHSRSHARGRARAPRLQLHRRDQAPARHVDAGRAGRTGRGARASASWPERPGADANGKRSIQKHGRPALAAGQDRLLEVLGRHPHEQLRVALVVHVRVQAARVEARPQQPLRALDADPARAPRSGPRARNTCRTAGRARRCATRARSARPRRRRRRGPTA